MEECNTNLHDELRNGNPTLDQRKNWATGLRSGLKYLEEIGIEHKAKKLRNFLVKNGSVRICDFGIVTLNFERPSYNLLGYTRKGSKFRDRSPLCKFCFLF